MFVCTHACDHSLNKPFHQLWYIQQTAHLLLLFGIYASAFMKSVCLDCVYSNARSMGKPNVSFFFSLCLTLQHSYFAIWLKWCVCIFAFVFIIRLNKIMSTENFPLSHTDFWSVALFKMYSMCHIKWDVYNLVRIFINEE